MVVSADTQDLLGIRPFIERFRDRFIELGIAEQNVIGAASGLATTGLHPYVCAYAPFITARSMEQVRNDVAYANQRVVIGAAASGISLGVAGGTHHAHAGRGDAMRLQPGQGPAAEGEAAGVGRIEPSVEMVGIAKGRQDRL